MYSINCQNPSVLFSQLIESSNNGILSFKTFLNNLTSPDCIYDLKHAQTVAELSRSLP